MGNKKSIVSEPEEMCGSTGEECGLCVGRERKKIQDLQFSKDRLLVICNLFFFGIAIYLNSELLMPIRRKKNLLGL